MCMKRTHIKNKGGAIDVWYDMTHCSCVITLLFFFQISVCAEQIVTEIEPPEKTKSLATVQQTRRQKMQQQK